MNKQSADYPETARLSPRMEDYLEAILEFLDTQPVVTVGEISKALQVSKSTVTSALNNLARQGHIEYQSYRF